MYRTGFHISNTDENIGPIVGGVIGGIVVVVILGIIIAFIYYKKKPGTHIRIKRIVLIWFPVWCISVVDVSEKETRFVCRTSY